MAAHGLAGFFDRVREIATAQNISFQDAKRVYAAEKEATARKSESTTTPARKSEATSGDRGGAARKRFNAAVRKIQNARGITFNEARELYKRAGGYEPPKQPKKIRSPKSKAQHRNYMRQRRQEPGTNRSAIIRAVYHNNPNATYGDVIAEAKAAGVVVKRGLVSVVKRQMGLTSKTRRGGRTVAAASRKTKTSKRNGDWAKAAAWLKDHPGSTPREIIEATGVVPQAAYQARTAAKARKASRKPSWKTDRTAYNKKHQDKFYRKLRKIAKQRGVTIKEAQAIYKRQRATGDNGSELGGQVTAALALIRECGGLEQATEVLRLVEQVKQEIG